MGEGWNVDKSGEGMTFEGSGRRGEERTSDPFEQLSVFPEVKIVHIT